jgi:hypothetical protein
MSPSRNFRSEGRQRDQTLNDVEAYPVAENGLLHRRSFLKKGLIFAGTSSALASGVEAARAAP